MLKRYLSHTAGALGAWNLTRHLTRRVPRIFMLHRFSATPDPRCTDAAELARLIDRITAECECVTMRELANRLDDPAPPRRPLAVITVDDGYADFHQVALPVLAERGIPATLYATAGFVDGQCWLWWDALRYLLDRHPGGPVTVEVDDKTVSVTLGDAASRHAAWSDIADLLVTRNEARREVISQLEKSAGETLPERPTEAYAAMTWLQLAEAENTGIEIGGHTMTHPYLPGLSSPALHHEIQDAKSLMERHLKHPLTTFAYPNGMPYDWTPEVADAVRAAGFKAAVLAHPRPFRTANRFNMGRWSADTRTPQLGHILSGASELKLVLTNGR